MNKINPYSIFTFILIILLLPLFLNFKFNLIGTFFNSFSNIFIIFFSLGCLVLLSEIKFSSKSNIDLKLLICVLLLMFYVFISSTASNAFLIFQNQYLQSQILFFPEIANQFVPASMVTLLLFLRLLIYLEKIFENKIFQDSIFRNYLEYFHTTPSKLIQKLRGILFGFIGSLLLVLLLVSNLTLIQFGQSSQYFDSVIFASIIYSFIAVLIELIFYQSSLIKLNLNKIILNNKKNILTKETYISPTKKRQIYFVTAFVLISFVIGIYYLVSIIPDIKHYNYDFDLKGQLIISQITTYPVNSSFKLTNLLLNDDTQLIIPEFNWKVSKDTLKSYNLLPEYLSIINVTSTNFRFWYNDSLEKTNLNLTDTITEYFDTIYDEIILYQFSKSSFNNISIFTASFSSNSYKFFISKNGSSINFVRVDEINGNIDVIYLISENEDFLNSLQKSILIKNRFENIYTINKDLNNGYSNYLISPLYCIIDEMNGNWNSVYCGLA